MFQGLASGALAVLLTMAPAADARPAEQDPSRWCNAPGSTEKPGHGRCGDDDAHCHRNSECRHYPPFTTPEDSEPAPEHGAHSGQCHDQGCARHCDKDGCWPEQDRERRPSQMAAPRTANRLAAHRDLWAKALQGRRL